MLTRETRSSQRGDSAGELPEAPIYITEEDQAERALASPQNLQPFFVLVRDHATGEYYHPHVHYVFSDDDPELVTNAVIDSLDHSSEADRRPEADEPSASGERYIVADMLSDGKTIREAKSLSPQWRCLDNKLTAAPTFDHEASETKVMMTITGSDAPHVVLSNIEKERAGGVPDADDMTPTTRLAADLETMAAHYDRELAELRRLTRGASNI